ncbi:MAG: alpha/beta fold hydrolase [Bradymonadia bacterium]
MTKIVEDEITTSTRDGLKLRIKHIHVPATEACGTLILTHAMMVDSRTFYRRGRGMAEFFATLGWHVFTFDFRGRRGVGPTPVEGGAWGYDDLVEQDLPAALDCIVEQDTPRPLVLGGHSLGGHASIASAGAGLLPDDIDAFLLLSTNIWRPSLEPKWWRRIQKALNSRLFDLITSVFGYFPSRRLRFGPCDEAHAYVQDLRRLWVTDRWCSRDGKTDYTEGARRLQTPILSVIGRGDRLMAHHEGAERWFADVGAGMKDYWMVGRGQFELEFDPDHMTVVTSPAASSLWREIDRWLQDKLTSR